MPVTEQTSQQVEIVLSFILKTNKILVMNGISRERDPREAVVNAFHLRGHGDCNYDAIKIHIKPDCIDVISYPGPGPTLTKVNNTESS